MNIFEAIDAGNGKATLPECNYCYVVRDTGVRYNWIWNNNTNATHNELRRNDWMPYVIQAYLCQNKTKCKNCEDLSINKIVKINTQGLCFYCNKEIKFFPLIRYFVETK